LNAFTTQCLFTEADIDDGGDEEDDINEGGNYDEEGDEWDEHLLVRYIV
jgi:hypothetical protein